jgi:enoyl-CoA hydratase/carnithine racemase
VPCDGDGTRHRPRIGRGLSATRESAVVTRRVDGRIGRLTLARPDKLNALSQAVLEQLTDAAAWFDGQPEVTVVVVAGEGRAFSAGFDLADPTWAELGPPEQSAAVGRAMTEAVGAMKAVTIAAIQGHCIGGGVVLASACDLRLAADDATFRIPEIDLGVPLYWTGVPRLARELGPALTKELILTGRAFGAEEARAIRFVNRVVPAADLADATEALGADKAAHAPGGEGPPQSHGDLARSRRNPDHRGGSAPQRLRAATRPDAPHR